MWYPKTGELWLSTEGIQFSRLSIQPDASACIKDAKRLPSWPKRVLSAFFGPGNRDAFERFLGKVALELPWPFWSTAKLRLKA